MKFYELQLKTEIKKQKVVLYIYVFDCFGLCGIQYNGADRATQSSSNNTVWGASWQPNDWDAHYITSTSLVQF